MIVEGDAWNWTFLKLYTDEGLTGTGEATLEYNALTSASNLDEARAFIIGRNPFHIESFLQDARARTFWQGPALFAAMAGIEMAMWDIVGKALNQPVYNLLGGPCRKTLRAYTHMGSAPATSGRRLCCSLNRRASSPPRAGPRSSGCRCRPST